MQTLANAIELIKKYSTEAWDKVYLAESRAAMLEGKDGKVQFSIDNARAVKVAKVSYGGLSDYERNNTETGAEDGLGTRGYQQASANFKWEERYLSQDRAAKYVIENMDNEETAGLAVGSATSEVNRTIVVPEVDAYCFATIAANVQAGGLGNFVSGAIDSTKPLAALNSAFKWLDDNEVPEENQIVFVSTDYFNNLRSTPELYRRLDVEGAIDHKVSFKIVSYEGRNLVVVPPRRFKMGFTKSAAGGYTLTGSAIDFIAMDKGAAVHVVKYHKQKILTGEAALANTDMDATVLFVRIYHDVFVFDNKLAGIYVHVGGYDTTLPTTSLTWDGGTLVRVIEQPVGVATKVYYKTQGGEELPDVGSTFVKGDYKSLKEGDTLANGTYIVLTVQGGIIASAVSKTIA